MKYIQVLIFLSLLGCGMNSEVKTTSPASATPAPSPVPQPDTSTYGTHTASNALRDTAVVSVSNLEGQTTSSQITLAAEVGTYKDGAALPNTGDLNYREIPDVNKDDDGYSGVNCKYAARPVADCGTSQTTIAQRIEDCANLNPTTSLWNGATQCNRGQGSWKLVTRNTANNEVWQDQRTGQLWSTKVSNSANWCAASGNTQNAAVIFSASYNNTAGTAITGNGTIGAISGGSSSVNETITITFLTSTTFSVSGTNCGGGSVTSGTLTAAANSSVTWSRANYCSFTLTQGSTPFAVNDKFILLSVAAGTYSCAPGAASGLQPASPISLCAEASGLNPSGETWSIGGYSLAKGGMGKLTAPSISWRLPTMEDYALAVVNGIQMVMPDMGIAGANRPQIDNSPGFGNYEWTATNKAEVRTHAWAVRPDGNLRAGPSARNLTTNQVRCIGR